MINFNFRCRVVRPATMLCRSFSGYVDSSAPSANTMRLTLIATVSLVASCATNVNAPFPPGPASQAKAYDGAPRPQTEVATVFISDGRPRYESGFVCKINGRKVVPDGGCVSVLYLTPGAHTIGVRYKSNIEVGEGELPIYVEAGKLYQLNTTSFRNSNRGRVSLIPMPQGAKVTYRNVAPNLFPASMLDQPVPYLAQ